MPGLSRRQVLGIAAGAGLGIAIAGLPLTQRTARADDLLLDRNAILENYAALYTGTEDSNAHPAVADKIAAIQTRSDQMFGRLRPNSDWVQYSGVIVDVRLGLENSTTGATASGRMTSTFRALAEIALATVTPGAASYGDRQRQDRVIEALRWVTETYYDVPGDIYTGTGEKYGDWFDWEIGSAHQITMMLAFMRDPIADVDPDLTLYCVDVMHSHLTFEPKFHTGANRADMTTNYFVQGALVGDDDAIEEGISQHLTVMADIDPVSPVDGITDGFYEDGSFLHHDNVAYNGSYGKNLLTRVVNAIKILHGT
ncbi:silent information regulator protein Sir2, partial [Pseudactinotalea sp. Z1732]